MKFYKLDPSVIERYNPSPINLIVGKDKTEIISDSKNYLIKIYKFGDIFEIYRYERPVFAGYHRSNSRVQKNTDKNTKIENREKVATRIRNTVRRLVLANFNSKSKFSTLTFAENVEDMDKANNEFKKYIQRLKYYYEDFKYLTVVEFQKRGAIHYHMIDDFGYIDQQELEKLWGNGFVWIRDLTIANKGKAVDNVGAYIVKYMNKETLDERLMGKKSFFTSKNLKRPDIIYENLEINACLEKYNLSINDLVYNNSFKSPENGMVTYLEFNKKRKNP